MAKRFGVVLPFTGTIYVEVEADDAESAIDAALSSEDLTLENADSWSCHKKIVMGNVFYGEQNEAEVVEEFDEEEE